VAARSHTVSPMASAGGPAGAITDVPGLALSLSLAPHEAHRRFCSYHTALIDHRQNTGVQVSGRAFLQGPQLIAADIAMQSLGEVIASIWK